MRTAIWLAAFVISCDPGPRQSTDAGDGRDGGNTCPNRCSDDLHAILDCYGTVVRTCSDTDACESTTVTCQDACIAAEANHRSVGCDFSDDRRLHGRRQLLDGSPRDQERRTVRTVGLGLGHADDVDVHAERLVRLSGRHERRADQHGDLLSAEILH